MYKYCDFSTIFTVAVIRQQTDTRIMQFIILSALVACAFAGPVMHAASDGVHYNFGYATGDAGGHARSESGTAGAVTGKYSYVDPNGNLREVRYTADASGFKPEGDISVDKKTAADAAAIAALAPKAPIPAVTHPYLHHGAPFYSHHLGAYPYYGQHLGYAYNVPHQGFSYGYAF